MAKKEEAIFVGIDDQVIELTGKEKEAFIAQRESDITQAEALKAQREAQTELRKSAYTKLGLTTEEIGAIL